MNFPSACSLGLSFHIKSWCHCFRMASPWRSSYMVEPGKLRKQVWGPQCSERRTFITHGKGFGNSMSLVGQNSLRWPTLQEAFCRQVEIQPQRCPHMSVNNPSPEYQVLGFLPPTQGDLD